MSFDDLIKTFDKYGYNLHFVTFDILKVGKGNYYFTFHKSEWDNLTDRRKKQKMYHVIQTFDYFYQNN